MKKEGIQTRNRKLSSKGKKKKSSSNANGGNSGLVSLGNGHHHHSLVGGNSAAAAAANAASLISMSDCIKPFQEHQKFSSFATPGQLSSAMNSMNHAMSAVNHYMHHAATAASAPGSMNNAMNMNNPMNMNMSMSMNMNMNMNMPISMAGSHFMGTPASMTHHMAGHSASQHPSLSSLTLPSTGTMLGTAGINSMVGAMA